MVQLEDKERRNGHTSLSIIIPALNEKEGIQNTIRAIPVAELGEMGCEVEILVVDNGSTDNTPHLARVVGARVIHEPRRGYGYAYKAGFAHATGEIIATADADMTYPVEDIPRMVRMLKEEDLDFITTNRHAFHTNGAMSPLTKFGNQVLHNTTRLLFRINLADSQSGMWVFRKDLLDRAVLRSNAMALSQELKIEACHYTKCRWKEVPIEYRHRVGRSKLRRWRDGFGNLTYLVRKRVVR